VAKRAIAIFVSDLHAGSWYSPWSGIESSTRAGSTYLSKCWKHFVSSCPDAHCLFLPGDLIDGRQSKSDGTGVFTTKLSEQVEGAIELLRPLIRKVDHVYRLQGTPYHESFDDPLIALDKEFHIHSGNVAQVMDVDVLGDGRLLNIAHHPASGAVIYMGTAVDKEALWSMVAAGAGKVEACRWIVRAHKHCYIEQSQENKTVVLLPGWQVPTPWAKKQNYWRYQSSIGGVLMVKDDWMHGEARFVPLTYAVPIVQHLVIGGKRGQAQSARV